MDIFLLTSWTCPGNNTTDSGRSEEWYPKQGADPYAGLISLYPRLSWHDWYWTPRHFGGGSDTISQRAMVGIPCRSSSWSSMNRRALGHRRVIRGKETWIDGFHILDKTKKHVSIWERMCYRCVISQIHLTRSLKNSSKLRDYGISHDAWHKSVGGHRDIISTYGQGHWGTARGHSGTDRAWQSKNMIYESPKSWPLARLGSTETKQYSLR